MKNSIYQIKTNRKLSIKLTIKLDNRNKLVMVKERGGLYKIISYKRNLVGLWRPSEYGLDYQTDLDGKKIISGDYQEFALQSNAIRWMKFLEKKYTTRVKFIID